MVWHPGKATRTVTILDDIATIGASLRRDGWRNTLSGLGVRGRDAAVSTSFDGGCDLSDPVLSDLYHYSDLPALIVDIFPEEALRRGLCVGGLEAEAAARWKERLLVRETIQEAARWGRLYGLSIVVIGASDGAPLEVPLDLSAPRPIAFLETYDRTQIAPVPVAGELFSAAATFRVTRQNGSQFLVHRSRCLVFGGAPTGKQVRERRAGADLSVLQRPYDILRDYANGYLALGNMLTEASTGVFTMKGIVEGLAGKRRDDLVARLNLMSAARSIANMVFLDAGGSEKYEKIATSFAGVPDTIDRLTGRLSVATGIPVERLGQALAGLNATGESTTRTWYDRVESYRETAIEPAIRYLARVELGPDVPIGVSFPALWQPTAAESATTSKTNVDAGVALYDRGAVTAEELSQLAPGAGITIDPNVPREGPAPDPTAPGLPVATSDDEDLTQAADPTDPHAAEYAARMTELGLARCEHGKSNRCRQCGIERLRGVEAGPDGTPVFRVAWRAIGGTVAPPTTPPAT